MIRRPTSARWPCRLAAATLLLPALVLGACRGTGGNAATPTAAQPGAPITPETDPRVQPHLQTFARAEAMITRWDALRNDGRMVEARALEPKIQAEVDADFPTFVQGARGGLGPHAQYLAVSALGFSARPEATTVLVERLTERDARLAGNALIAIGVRGDPNTPMDALLNRTTPAMPPAVKRYAPLALGKIIEARSAAGYPPNAGVRQQALVRLGALAVDPDPVVRLHVVRGLQATELPGAYDYLAVLVGDPQMRVRWAAAGAMERLGDPRGFPGVVRLLHDVAPDSKHVIRDILVSYAGRLEGRPLTEAEVESLGVGPRAWSQWFTMYRRTHGLAAGSGVQPNGAVAPTRPMTGQPPRPMTGQPTRPMTGQPSWQPARGSVQPGPAQPAPTPTAPAQPSRRVQPAPRELPPPGVQPGGAARGGG